MIGTTQPRPIAEQPKGQAWYSQSCEEVLSRFGSTDDGLSAQQAAQRLAADGLNELKEGNRVSALRIFLGQFKSVIIWILIAAGVLSAVLGQMIDAIAILVIVVLNAGIGFYQEFSAEKSIAALKEMTAPLAKVKREGQVTSLPASTIVTGDIIVLEAGDIVAADARLLEAASLQCIESALMVFAELLRSFGARSETKQVWRISLFTNINLVAVVAISIGLQVSEQRDADPPSEDIVYAVRRLSDTSGSGRYSALCFGDSEDCSARPDTTVGVNGKHNNGNEYSES